VEDDFLFSIYIATCCLNVAFSIVGNTIVDGGGGINS